MAFCCGQEMLNFPLNVAINPHPMTLQPCCSVSGIMKKQGIVGGKEADVVQVNNRSPAQSQVHRWYCGLCPKSLVLKPPFRSRHGAVESRFNWESVLSGAAFCSEQLDNLTSGSLFHLHCNFPRGQGSAWTWWTWLCPQLQCSVGSDSNYCTLTLARNFFLSPWNSCQQFLRGSWEPLQSP